MRIHISFAERDGEHERAVLRHLFACLAEECEPRTLEALQRLAIEGQSAEELAAAIGLTAGAVYVAKSRVLTRRKKTTAWARLTAAAPPSGFF